MDGLKETEQMKYRITELEKKLDDIQHDVRRVKRDNRHLRHKFERNRKYKREILEFLQKFI